MTAADRPSVTDNARAEALRREPLQWRESEDWRDGFVAGAEWAAGRAETTTALPRPGDGCQCTSHTEDRGGGHYELVAEYEPACPEHSEHVWNPRTGMWEHRAETTTEGYPDAEGLAALRENAETTTDNLGDAYMLGYSAAARTRPTREQLIDTLVMSPLSDTAGTDLRPFEQTADAVLALLEGGERP